MTCLVGVVKDGHITMGCDGVVIDGNGNVTVSRDSKIIRKGDLLIGTAGSWRLSNLVHHVFVPPARKPRTPDMKYLAGPFVDALHRCLRDHAPRVEATAERDGMLELNLMVGFRGALYAIESEFDVTRSTDDFDALGSGCQVARGALYATPKLAPKTRVLKALAAADRYKESVGKPFKVFVL